MTVMATSLPGPRTHGAQDLATRFRLSLVLRVKTTSRASGVPMRAATCARTSAMAAVAATERL